MTDSAKTSAPKSIETAVETMTADAAANMREMTEQNVERARAAYDNFKDSAQETVDLLDGSANAFKTGSADINAKAVEFAQANVNSSFEFARKAFAVKDVHEFVELQSQFAQNLFQTYTKQAQDLSQLSVKVAEKTSKPITDGVMKSMEQVKQVFPTV
jgi:phasin